ncbi:MAG: glycosyltransferase family 4 protein [Candidatus Hydrogenedentes bacterium]|nr:glycosyltransferase family 4 protein [Candidatus Hydrogenedentota bacterium]
MAPNKGARILFLTLYPDTAASPRYRVAQFIPYLESRGFRCTVAAPLTSEEYAALTGPNRTRRPFFYHFAETRRRIAQLLGARRYDIVFVQKALMTAYIKGLPALLRARARRLVYDIDDAVHLAPPHPLRGLWRVFEDPGQVRRLFRQADLVLAGNAWLQSVAAKHAARAELFPTVVDTDRFIPPNEPPKTYRVGWIGSPSTTPHLSEAAPALEKLTDAEIRLVGADPTHVAFGKNRDRPKGAPEARDGTVSKILGSERLSPAGGGEPAAADLGVDSCISLSTGEPHGSCFAVPRFFAYQCIEAIPWSLDTEVAEIQGFSVGIMPLPATEWNRGKCALKALQYMACRVPCVASPFGAIRGIIKHNENGLLADSHAAWEQAFERLRDPKLRRQLGEQGRATIESRFSLKGAAPRMVELLESLL